MIGYSSTTTQDTSATSSRAKATDTEASAGDDLFGEEDEYEEEGEGVITGVTRPQRRIVLTKRTYLLVAFVIVTILSIAATVYTFVFHLDEYDYPPTQHSDQSVRDTLRALIALTIVTPIGFIILKFRITNLVIGVLYLFLLVFCLLSPAKGIAEAIYSLKDDTDLNIHRFARNPYLEHKVHNFWAAFQSQYSCCGTKDIDRVEDWPYFINSSDLPASCCTDKQKKYAKSLRLLVKRSEFSAASGKGRKPELDKTSSYCGRGMGRTRNRGLGIGYNQSLMFKRVFSGFFLSLTESQVEKMILNLNSPAFYSHPQKIRVEIMDVTVKRIRAMNTILSFNKIWKNFYVDAVCNTFDAWVDYERSVNASFNPVPLGQDEKYCTNTRTIDFDNDIAYPANLNHGLPIDTVGIIRNLTKAVETCRDEGYKLYLHSLGKTKFGSSTLSPEEYCQDQLPETRQNATTIGRELLLQLDFLTTYIYELGIYDAQDSPVKRGTWMLWPIPTRLDHSELYPYKLNANYLRASDDKKLKKMYYFSRGIAENFILESLIHPKTCESLDEAHLPNIRKKVARDLNRRWRRSRPFSEWKNKNEGLGFFFLKQVRKITYITIGVCSAAIFCVIILAVVFWQYYSRIKAEEYANLALPKEFEVLHLRRGSVIDDTDIAREFQVRQFEGQVLNHRGKVAPTPLKSSVPAKSPAPAKASASAPTKPPGQSKKQVKGSKP